MFEVKAYIGDYRKGGFISYTEAAAHARDKVVETGQSHVVNEITLRCIITKKDIQWATARLMLSENCSRK